MLREPLSYKTTILDIQVISAGELCVLEWLLGLNNSSWIYLLGDSENVHLSELCFLKKKKKRWGITTS